uniref:Uncharacterized protein n=1 Tax=Arundo donax TaxID=35708 RepID=A0A0A9HYV0_ARUDO
MIWVKKLVLGIIVLLVIQACATLIYSSMYPFQWNRSTEIQKDIFCNFKDMSNTTVSSVYLHLTSFLYSYLLTTGDAAARGRETPGHWHDKFRLEHDHESSGWSPKRPG